MGLTLDDFHPIWFQSVRNVTAREYKSLNAHRAIIEVRGSGSSFTATDFEEFRREITKSIQTWRLKGFGFGLVLDNFEVCTELLDQWVDNTTRRGGACQWVIVKHENRRVAAGVHMWQEGLTTKIYEDLLADLSSRGFAVTSRAKRPTGLMKFAVKLNPLLALQMYKPSIPGITPDD